MEPLDSGGADVDMQDQSENVCDDSEEDEISASFYGKLTSILSHKDEAGQLVHTTTKDKFQNMLLNLDGEKDIYAAWEKDHRQLVDIAVGNQTMQAEKTDWIEQLPDVMILQLNRLKFHEGKPVKMTHRVPLHKELHPDRFLKKNSEEVLKQRAKVEALRKKIDYLDSCLDQYKNFGPCGIFQALETAVEFLEHQGQKGLPAIQAADAEALKGIKPHSPFKQTPAPQPA